MKKVIFITEQVFIHLLQESSEKITLSIIEKNDPAVLMCIFVAGSRKQFT